MEITRNRTIRPSTRLDKSKSYKIDTKTISRNDILVVNIVHESKPFCKSYKFNGSDLENLDSISFRVFDYGTSFDITWSGVIPIETVRTEAKILTSAPIKKVVDKVVKKQYITEIKTSFDPISSDNTTILVLGTLPGEKSLEVSEYYGHSGNKFWKIISEITGNRLPLNYEEKKELLIKTNIGIWDVVQKANRKGSLDSAIEMEEPNDLESFIASHKNLKVIGFNGKKCENLFGKYFDRKKNIKYISLPSTSPANAGISFANICKQWQQLLTNN